MSYNRRNPVYDDTRSPFYWLRLWNINRKFDVTTLFCAMALLLILFGTFHARAQGIGVGSRDDVNFAPLITALQPYILCVLGAICTGLIGWATSWWNAYASKHSQLASLQINAQMKSSIESAMKTQAASMVAAAADNLASRTFHVGSPEVAAATNAVVQRIPDLVAKSGATPETLQTILTAEIGKLQVAQAPQSPEKQPEDDAAPIGTGRLVVKP
jgi:hypothetical protein